MTPPTAADVSDDQLTRSPLVHLIGREEWATAQENGRWEPGSLAEVGFVHLSALEQVHLPANVLYVGRSDLLALVIDPSRVAAPIKWEPGDPDDPASLPFPHLYGPLPVDAVIDVRTYPPGPDGAFAPLEL
ncbi:DUF952 domain-containing protein [Gordonia soli]|uniref:Glutathione S-transferase n=1 Tax=Gordonia soli NBRC 108243 TaxID=1223545 RepID=M0QKW2_9ACTN|nr:DUF952 domain-containing protein [Gordonia soli]GAC68901.1 hypothetical protein GS4_19_00910 [Gordonia soli NBRC 108243]